MALKKVSLKSLSLPYISSYTAAPCTLYYLYGKDKQANLREIPLLIPLLQSVRSIPNPNSSIMLSQEIHVNPHAPIVL